jgi:hypothetical protein
LTSGLGKGLNDALDSIERDGIEPEEPTTELTPEQQAQYDELQARLTAAMKDDGRFGRIIADRALIHEFRDWIFALPQNHREIWHEGDRLIIHWSDELDQIMENSFAYFDRQEIKELIKKHWEIYPGPDPETASKDEIWRDPEGRGIYTLSHTKQTCDSWWGSSNGYRAIHPNYVHAVIDRSIAYWNQRGHDLRRPER